MEIFINESSLSGQFDDQRAFIASIKIFLSSIAYINEIVHKKKVYKSAFFFSYYGMRDQTHINSVLKANPAINAAFVNNLQKTNPINWQDEQHHENTSLYECLGQDFVGTSVAELTERKIKSKDLKGFLLNFENSQFGNDSKIEVLKNDAECIQIDCNIDQESVHQWLIDNGLLNIEEQYDPTLRNSPLDHQTVLRDTNIFQPTGYPKNNGRIVYRRIGTNELWVVDSSPFHANAKAHIEVFSEVSRKHLGTSLYNEINLNSNFKKPDRWINLG